MDQPPSRPIHHFTLHRSIAPTRALEVITSEILLWSLSAFSLRVAFQPPPIHETPGDSRHLNLGSLCALFDARYAISRHSLGWPYCKYCPSWRLCIASTW